MNMMSKKISRFNQILKMLFKKLEIVSKLKNLLLVSIFFSHFLL